MRRIPIVFILTLTALTVRAQYDVVFSHYWAMEPSFNPAAVGKEAKLNVAAAYALQMAGFEHNPNTMYAAADMSFYALKSYHGAGVQFVSDNIGLFSHKRLGLQYAYQPQLLGGRLSLGAQLSMISENFDGSKLEVEDSSDPAFTTSSVNGTGFDISLGIYYKHRDWYAGLSVLHLNSPTVELGEKNELSISSSYYLTGGYNIRLRNPFLTIHPTVLARTDGTAYRVDVTARVKYTHDRKMLYGGIGYSPTNSVTAMVGGNFHGICLGYSYEMFTSGTGLGNGSHELFVGYQTELNLFKKGRNRHQSVRIL